MFLTSMIILYIHVVSDHLATWIHNAFSRAELRAAIQMDFAIAAPSPWRMPWRKKSMQIGSWSRRQLCRLRRGEFRLWCLIRHS